MAIFNLRRSTTRTPDPHRLRPDPGGEGGSVLRNILAQPTPFTEALSPGGLLFVSLLLSALLVAVATAALAT
jgi:hypothetical protein